MTTVKLVITPGAVEELLKSEEVQADLAERGAAIAAAAGEGFVSESFVGRARARERISTATVDAMLAEAKDRVLTRAIDAGR